MLFFLLTLKGLVTGWLAIIPNEGQELQRQALLQNTSRCFNRFAPRNNCNNPLHQQYSMFGACVVWLVRAWPSGCRVAHQLDRCERNQSKKVRSSPPRSSSGQVSSPLVSRLGGTTETSDVPETWGSAELIGWRHKLGARCVDSRDWPTATGYRMAPMQCGALILAVQTEDRSSKYGEANNKHHHGWQKSASPNCSL